ncbi:MAG TPA: hypothetical protein VK939_06635 [Longimicrobiales bacterium]|nr:hypothetical protein [Longimicrobiales bacterium]
MRSRSLTSPGTVAALALFTACAEMPGEPRLDEGRVRDAPAVAFSQTDNNGRGSKIDIFQNIQFLLIYDAQSQLLSAHMPSDICGAGEFNVIDVRRVRTPSPVNSVASTITDDDSQAAVYRAESPGDAGLSGDLSFFGFADIADLSQFCAFLGGPNLIAEGTVQSISTFSAASFHLRRTGIIQGLDGQDYQLTEVYQLNADAHDPNNPDTFTEVVSRISLNPVR